MTATESVTAAGAPLAHRYRIVSADDHLIEPPDLFEGRMPAALQERAPRIVESATAAKPGSTRAATTGTSG